MIGPEWTLRLYIIEWQGAPLILVPNLGGSLEPAIPGHPILRVSYVSRDSAASEPEIVAAKQEMQGRFPLLLMTFPCPDGPPYRCGVIFCHNQPTVVNWTDGRHSKPATSALEYLAAVTLNKYPWGNDLILNRPGYFLSGPSEADTLWRIARVEFDVLGRQLFTLSPVRLAAGLPDVDFSTITNDLLRQKLVTDWSEVQRCVSNHMYSTLITTAKNVAESLVVFALNNLQGKLTLDQALTKLGDELKAKRHLALPFTFLDYHLMSKMRILHGHTHSDRVTISGMLVEPEFALTVAHDLVQVLRSTGLAR
jgi:hypothetical protein